MSSVIVIRKARPEDEGSRAALIRSSFAGYQRDAFFLFFFQELTLQIGVLSGAVLFIFLGVSVSGLLLLPPVLAVVVAVGVHLTHAVLADKRTQEMRKEVAGFVAELHGPLLVDPRTQRPPVVLEEDWRPEHKGPVHTQVIGTLSVSEFWGPEREGWLHALAAHPDWRRRRIATNLLLASQQWARSVQWSSLHAVLSELQSAAACTFRSRGFKPRGAYHRRLCGATLTLAMSHVVSDV